MRPVAPAVVGGLAPILVLNFGRCAGSLQRLAFMSGKLGGGRSGTLLCFCYSSAETQGL